LIGGYFVSRWRSGFLLRRAIRQSTHGALDRASTPPLNKLSSRSFHILVVIRREL
jgi:hypothetical protein